MNTQLDTFFYNCQKTRPTSQKTLTLLPKDIPQSYIDFLKYSNGAEGELANGSYVELWKAEELQDLNDEYKTKEFVPGLFFIGSDGGDEAIGIDLREDSKTFGQYYKVTFIPMSWEYAILLGPEITDIKII
jgi:hypothetical protein